MLYMLQCYILTFSSFLAIIDIANIATHFIFVEDNKNFSYPLFYNICISFRQLNYMTSLKETNLRKDMCIKLGYVWHVVLDMIG